MVLFVLFLAFLDLLINSFAILHRQSLERIYFFLSRRLSGSFLKGMFGLDGKHTEVQPNVFILSLIVILLSFFIMKLPIIGQYSVLFSIVCGWILFACFGLSNPITPVTDIIRFPSLFVFGMPRVEWNMVITVIFVTLLLLTNMLASIRVVQKVVSKYEENAHQSVLNKLAL